MQLHNEAREEQLDVKHNNEGPPILKMKVKNDLKHMQSGKIPGTYNITTEIKSA